MSTLDEITKEKQRVSEALARVDAQREKLASQLSELEATERVLARYSKGARAGRAASAAIRRRRGPIQRDQAGASAGPLQNQRARAVPRVSMTGSLPWQPARRG